MTAYRVGDDTPFLQSLVKAAEGGKQIAYVIEINSRSDLVLAIENTEFHSVRSSRRKRGTNGAG